MLRLAALALLALPLAGCSGPSATEAPPHPPAAASGAAPALRLAADEEPFLGCPPVAQRDEEAQVGRFTVRVHGCIALNEPLLLAGLPEDPEVRFDVPRGAKALLAQFHLHGPELVNATLVGPDGHGLARASERGGGARDALARFELDAPPSGSWRLEAEVQELAAARGWTATIVVAS